MRLDFLQVIDFQDVTRLQFIEFIQADTAFVAGLHFLNIVLEAFQRTDFPFVNYLVLALDPDQGVAFHLAVQDI